MKLGAGDPAVGRAPIAEDEADEQQDHPDRDEDVAEIERGPVLGVDEVRDVPLAHAIDEVRQAAPEQEPERHRHQRVTGTRPGEVDEHPDDGDRRSGS